MSSEITATNVGCKAGWMGTMNILYGQFFQDRSTKHLYNGSYDKDLILKNKTALYLRFVRYAQITWFFKNIFLYYTSILKL